MKVKMKRMMGLFLALAVSIGCLSLSPTVSYADDANAHTFNINDGSVNITQGGNYTINGTGKVTSNTISVIGSNITATITLHNVNIYVSDQNQKAAFLAKNNDQSNVNLTIILEGTNSLKSNAYGNWAGLTWNNSDNNSMLEIKGDGSLYAVGGNWGAGIGSSSFDSGKNITITGGTVTASGGYDSNAIGGGYQGSAENITITGGSVKAGRIDATPTDSNGNHVYLAKLENQDGVNDVTVYSGTGNAKTFKRAGNHPYGDTAFYLYLTTQDHSLVTSKGKYKAEWHSDFNMFTISTITKFNPKPGDVEINDKNFSDKHFRSYVKQFDRDDNYWLSKDELDGVTSISIENQSVSNLKGIEYFKNLKELHCNNNNLTELDLSGNPELIKLYCSQNKLTSLNVSKNTKLTNFGCDHNELKSLDVSKNTELTELWCDNNYLTSLNLNTNTRLTDLNCAGNYLTSLNLGDNTNPTSMNLRRQHYDITVVKGTRKFRYSDFPERFEKGKVRSPVGATFGDDALTVKDDNTSEVTYKYKVRDSEMDVKLNVTYAVVEIDDAFPDEYFRDYVSQNLDTNVRDGKLDQTELDRVTEIKVSNKRISSLKGIEWFKNLEKLYCGNNNLTSLDVSKNPKLEVLGCDHNNLTSLDLSNNTKLTELYCHNNQLKSLDVSNNTSLIELDCSNNELTSLDLSKNRIFMFGVWNFAENPLTFIKLSKNSRIWPDMFQPVKYTVTVEKGSKKVPFSKLPRDFDKSRIKSDVQRDEDGFTWDGSNPIRFRYQLRKNLNELDDPELTIVNAEITVTEGEFDSAHVNSMTVTTQPSKLTYTEDDKLDLAGLVVTLKDDNGVTKDVPFADFSTYKITATPENETPLTADYNGEAVKLTKHGVRDVAETGKLIVYHQSSGGSGSSAGHAAGGAGVGAGSGTGHGSSTGTGVGVNDDAPTILGRGELNIQIGGAEGDSKPGSAAGGSAAGSGNAVENALEVKRADEAVKQAANALDDALAWAKHVAADPNATKAQVDAAVRRLVEARKAFADAKANVVKVRAAVRNRVVRGMRSRGDASNAGVGNNAVNDTVENAPGVKRPQRKPRFKTPAAKPQSRSQSVKRVGVVPKRGGSALYAGLLAVLGFSVVGLAVFCRKRMMEGNK